MKSPLQPLAATLRQRQTDVERKLWFALRDRRLHGMKFRRQVPIGPYIVDFLCKEANLIIELDGGQHTAEIDQARSDWLQSLNLRLLRFWNNDIVQNLPGVLETIVSALETSPACGRGQGEGLSP